MYRRPDGRGLLVHSDCLTYMRRMKPESVDLIVADPPYGIGYHSNRYQDKNPHAPIVRDWNFRVLPFLTECARVLKDGAAAYVFCRWDVSVLWAAQIPPALKLKTIIIWVKNSHSSGDLTGCFGNQYEQILFLVKGRHRLRGPRYSNVWQFDRIPHRKLLHPAQKPTDLLCRILESSSDENAVVLDPFAGSGSTGEACIQMNRRFVLIDLDAAMLPVIGKRLGIDVPASPEAAEPATPPSSFQLAGGHDLHPEDIALLAEQIRQNRE